MTTVESHIATLDALFGSHARAELMRAILIDPRRAFYQRQLERATGLPLRAVQRELEKLVSLGIAYRWNEGRRVYYQLDTTVPFFSELRNFVLKTCTPRQRLRAMLAEQRSVRIAILSVTRDEVLVVTQDAVGPELPALSDHVVQSMSADTFFAALDAAPETLEKFLSGGEDLLGRRDDVIWHRIESAGFDVQKGEDVP